MKSKLKYYFPIFVLPTLLAFLIAFLVPFIIGFFLSFCDFTTITDATFVGIQNYVDIFDGRDGFTSAFIFTVMVVIVSIVSVNLFAFAIAWVLTRKLKGTNFFRTVFFMPNLIGGIVLGYTWQIIINSILSEYGATLVSDWKYGYLGLIVLINWQIDGAGRWQVLRNVTIPMVMPSITICLFLTLSNTFKMYDQNLALTNGAPSGKTEMVALNIVNSMFAEVGAEGVGQAKAVIFVVVVVVIAMFQLRTTRAREIEA